MSVRRIRMGKLAGTERGIRISKPGYDALTTGPENLLLNATDKYSNLLKLGIVYGTTTVALGFGARPFVTVTAIGDLSSAPDIVWPPNMIGPLRPSPVWMVNHVGDQTAYAIVSADGSTMSIFTPVKVWYSVYSRITGA